jgi:hypothetical protein
MNELFVLSDLVTEFMQKIEREIGYKTSTERGANITVFQIYDKNGNILPHEYMIAFDVITVKRDE